MKPKKESKSKGLQESADVPSWVDAKDGEPSSRPGSTLTNPKKVGILEGKEFNASVAPPLIVCAHEWNIEKSNPLSFIPRKKHALARIELHRNQNLGLSLNGYRDLELGSEPSDWSELVQAGDKVVFHLFKKKTSKVEQLEVYDNNSESSTSTLSSMGLGGVDTNFTDALANLSSSSTDWSLKFSLPLEKTTLKLDGSKVLAEFDLGNQKKKRVLFHFSMSKQSKHFFMFVKALKVNLRQASMNSSQVNRSIFIPRNVMEEPIQILVEIISATDLKAVKAGTADPFVIVKYGGEEIHKTSTIKNSLDPIWTILTKSLFTFNLDQGDFHSHDLMFEVRHNETLNSTGVNLGQCTFPIQKLVNRQGERNTMKLSYIQTGKSAQGYLAVRFKRATASELEFLENVEAGEFLTKEYFNDFVTPKVGKQKALPMMRKKKIGGKTYYLARPIQKDVGEQWMTSEQIQDLARTQSQFWTEIGEGKLGQLYVEILGMDELVQLDRNSMVPGDKSDAYVTVAFEDAAISTDVIKDCSKPRFLPWTRRAFKFNMNYISSNLFIGCFDHDFGANPDDPVGRLCIPIERFVPSTTYNLSYKVYDSDQISNRTPRAYIHLRIRLELKRPRDMFFNALTSSPTKYSIHFNSNQNYHHTEYTVKGYRDVQEYDLKTFFSLLNEILSYQSILFILVEAFKTVWLWRGHKKLSFCGCNVFIPLHSMIMFTFAIIITEKPQYTLSCFFASIAWAMMALLEQRRKRPSSWGKPPSYGSLLTRLITNSASPQTIEECENEDADLDYVTNAKEKAEKQGFAVEKFWHNFNEDIEEWEELTADTSRKHKKQNKKARLGMLKNTLYPVQKMLYDWVLKLRFVSSIFSWNQMFLSFWITTIAILLSVVSFYVANRTPNIGLICQRLVLYSACGPWNKFLDIIYFQKYDAMTKEEKQELERRRLREHGNRFQGPLFDLQQLKESRDKTDAIKTLMFGKQAVHLPDRYSPEKYYPVPLTDSSAFPNKTKPEDDFRQASRRLTLKGQR